VIARYHSSVVMNAIGWEGIFVCCPEFMFNDLLVQCIEHGVSDKCIEKYTARGWHELVWKDAIVHMEQMDSLNFRLQNAHQSLVFTLIWWNVAD
jgi:hypothetical protein